MSNKSAFAVGKILGINEHVGTRRMAWGLSGFLLGILAKTIVAAIRTNEYGLLDVIYVAAVATIGVYFLLNKRYSEASNDQ